jgi:hypothetical protein
MFFASFFYGLFGGGWGGVDEREIPAFVQEWRGGVKNKRGLFFLILWVVFWN